MVLQRLISIGATSCRRQFTRNYAAPNAKYVQIYKTDFGREAVYPVELLGASHVDFAKLLFTFADRCESKNFKLYLSEFNKLGDIAKKLGPFWHEEKFLDSPHFQGLNEGFKFVLAWMQSEGAMDRLERVEAAYKELANEASHETTAVVTFTQPKAKMDEKLVAEVTKEAAAMHQASALKDYKLTFEYKVDPSIKGGYMLEVCNQVVNRSTAAQAATEALSQASATHMDWTAMPAAPPRPSPSPTEALVRLLGAAVNDLAEADKLELKYGA